MRAASKKIDIEIQNKDTDKLLVLKILVIENTDPERIEKNVRVNSAKQINWLQESEQHSTPVIMINGGPSINDHIEDIKNLQRKGATVFAMNAASKWAHKHDILVDYQVMMDSSESTIQHVDPDAKQHLFASQCNEQTVNTAKRLTLWHLDRPGVKDWLPPAKETVIVGGDVSAGICSLCVAYTMGYREFHVFGMDTSCKDGKGHAYEQKLNDGQLTMEMEWAGRKYIMPMSLRDQPGAFLLYTNTLKLSGCTFEVYGEGLLQAMYGTDPDTLSEKEKYQLMWSFGDYRYHSPGEQLAQYYLDLFGPEGTIIDFGCGTGRAGLIFAKTNDVHLIDITDNSRDKTALDLPFTQWDLTAPIPIDAPNGFCTDVMEHLPPEDVEKAIVNIMDSADKVFFQISTVHDGFGEDIGCPLHLTVEPHQWWADLFERLGYVIIFEHDKGTASIFYIQHIGENNAS